MDFERDKKRAEDDEIQSVALDDEIMHSFNSSIKEAAEELEGTSRITGNRPSVFQKGIESARSDTRMADTKNATVSEGNLSQKSAEVAMIMELPSAEVTTGHKEDFQVIDEANIGLDLKSENTVAEQIVNPHHEEFDTTNPI